MEVCKTILDAREIINRIKKQNKIIGFVPTMGALHKGHISLIQQSRKETDYTVVSIYVNPLQFGPKEDFAKYPRNLENDLNICKKEGVDLVFAPADAEMYPDASQSSLTETYIDQYKLSKLLCGKFRKNHFRGVMTVVAKLFNIVKPDIAYFGAKDYQQAKIIQQMVKDLNFDITIKIMPTIREEDGLAISSRNQYLTNEERKEAPIIYKTLVKAKEKILNNKCALPSFIKQFIRKQLIKNMTTLKKIDYIEVIHPETLESIKKIEIPCVIAVALHTINARLIDNILVSS